MSPIDPRTRDNPEAAMVHAKPLAPQLMNGDPSKFSSGQMGGPWPWPKDGDLSAKREASSESGQVPAPHPDAIDRSAYERFMRSLG